MKTNGRLIDFTDLALYRGLAPQAPVKIAKKMLKRKK